MLWVFYKAQSTSHVGILPTGVSGIPQCSTLTAAWLTHGLTPSVTGPLKIETASGMVLKKSTKIHSFRYLQSISYEPGCIRDPRENKLWSRPPRASSMKKLVTTHHFISIEWNGQPLCCWPPASGGTSGGGAELRDPINKAARKEAKSKRKGWMKNRSAPWVPSLASWTSAFHLTSYFHLLAFTLCFQEFFISKKNKHVACLLDHTQQNLVYLPLLLGQARNGVKPDCWPRRLQGQRRQCLVKGSADSCLSNIPTSLR